MSKELQKKIITGSRKGKNGGVKKKKKRIQKQCKKIEKQCKKDLGGLIERQGKRPNPSPGSHMSLSHNALDADAGKYQETTFQNRRRWKALWPDNLRSSDDFFTFSKQWLLLYAFPRSPSLMMSFFILGEVNKGHGESRFVFPKYSISESRGKRQELLIFLLMMRKSLDNLHVGIFLPGSSPQIPNVLDCILNAYFKPNIARLANAVQCLSLLFLPLCFLRTQGPGSARPP